MPSPLAHASLALLATPALTGADGRPRARTKRLALWTLVLVFLLLPDADIAVGALTSGDPFAAHGTWSHSFVLAPLAGVAFALIVRTLSNATFSRATLVGALCYASHVALDAITHGRGVAMLWPIIPERIPLPFELFSGVRHSEPGNFAAHARTLAEESVFVLVVSALAFGIARLRRTPSAPAAEPTP